MAALNAGCDRSGIGVARRHRRIVLRSWIGGRRCVVDGRFAAFLEKPTSDWVSLCGGCVPQFLEAMYKFRRRAP